MPHSLRRPVTVAVLLGTLATAWMLVGATRTGAATRCTASAAWGKSRADLASQVVVLVNKYRAERDLGRVAVSPPLTASSTWKSLHMAGYRYFAHDDPAPPVARTALERARSCGYRGGAWGENIAWGYPSARAVMTGWIKSPGHRASIESPGFTSVGVGVATGAGGSLYWTLSFGKGTTGNGSSTADTLVRTQSGYVLGGLGAAADALERWGRSSALMRGSRSFTSS